MADALKRLIVEKIGSKPVTPAGIKKAMNEIGHEIVADLVARAFITVERDRDDPTRIHVSMTLLPASASR